MNKIKSISLLFAFLLLSLGAKSQSFFKLMCEPVTFTSWVNINDMYFHQETMTVSFWEDGNKAAYITIQHNSSGSTQIIPLQKEVSITSDGRFLMIEGKAEEMGLGALHILVPRNKITADSFHLETMLATISISEEGQATQVNYLIAEFGKKGIQEKLSRKSNKYIKPFNDMVDYVNRVFYPSYSGYFTFTNE